MGGNINKDIDKITNVPRSLTGGRATTPVTPNFLIANM